MPNTIQPKIDYDLFGPIPRQPRKMFAVGGYAAKPGTGPAGKTCKQCQGYVKLWHHGRYYPKCEMNRVNWTHGRGTDIKASVWACAYFIEEANHGKA